MFNLKNIEGNIKLSIEVTGYQFPDSKEDDWCMLKVTVEQPGEKCELIDPAIETIELVQLLRWFSSLSEGRLPRYSHLTFTEPCISFEFLSFKNGIVKVGIWLSHELKPPFLMNQLGTSTSNWCIVFDLEEKHFVGICDGIKSTLDRCPVRGS